MQEFRIGVDDLLVHLYCSQLDSRLLLQEAQRRGIPLTASYSAQYHVDRTGRGQNHIHVYCKNNQLFALNRDGTAHDQSHGVRIPGKVARAIQQRFPDIQLPPDNIIEKASPQDELEVLLEAPPNV